MNVLDMKTMQLMLDYDRMIRATHLKVLGIDKYSYQTNHWMAELNAGRGSGDSPFWSPHTIVECEEGPHHLEILLQDIQFCINCLEQGEYYCPPCMDESLDQILWEMDTMIHTLDYQYPLV